MLASNLMAIYACLVGGQISEAQWKTIISSAEKHIAARHVDWDNDAFLEEPLLGEYVYLREEIQENWLAIIESEYFDRPGVAGLLISSMWYTRDRKDYYQFVNRLLEEENLVERIGFSSAKGLFLPRTFDAEQDSIFTYHYRSKEVRTIMEKAKLVFQGNEMLGKVIDLVETGQGMRSNHPLWRIETRTIKLWGGALALAIIVWGAWLVGFNRREAD